MDREDNAGQNYNIKRANKCFENVRFSTINGRRTIIWPVVLNGCVNFICHTRRRKWAEGTQEQAAEEGVWA